MLCNDKLTADFSFAYSANVSASSRDRHLLRSLEIIDDFIRELRKITLFLDFLM